MVDTIINILKMEIEFFKNPVVNVVGGLIAVFLIFQLANSIKRLRTKLDNNKNEWKTFIMQGIHRVLMMVLLQVIYVVFIADSVFITNLIILKIALLLFIILNIMYSLDVIREFLLRLLIKKNFEKKGILASILGITTIFISISLLIATLYYPIN